MSSSANNATDDARLIVSVAAAPVDSSADVATSGAVAQPITLTNANAMMAAGSAFISASKTVEVRLDMQAVEATSVAVAVALAWLSCAQRTHKKLCLSHLSADFSGVIEFSGIASMFAEHISASAGEAA